MMPTVFRWLKPGCCKRKCTRGGDHIWNHHGYRCRDRYRHQQKIWNGKHGIAGEWGHNFLDNSGGPCYCGKTGCVETVISGPATERYYESITGKRIRLK